MRHPETAFHIAVVHYIRLSWPHLFMFHSPQGGYQLDPRTAAKLRAMGQLAGVPDLGFVLPGARIGFIELKVGKGRLSPDQIDVIGQLEGLGCKVAICRTLEEVVAALVGWGCGEPRARIGA